MSTASPLRPPRAVAPAPTWPSVREAVLARDKHRCRGDDCAETAATAELHVHHLLPRKHGGRDDPANLITLCDSCHAARHPNVQIGLARRAIERAAVSLAKLVDRSNELPDDPARLTAALHVLGKKGFREGQIEVILAALRGESVLVVRPTGFGKSLCFQVPALMTAGTTLVLSPLKALMNDQVGGLQKLKIPASFINSESLTGGKGRPLPPSRGGRAQASLLRPGAIQR